MRVELNEEIKVRLEAISQLMKTEKRVPQTAYFPFIDITEEAKSKLDKNKVQLSAFMNATYKKKSRGE